MGWLAVDKNGGEGIYIAEPYRDWRDFVWRIRYTFNTTCAIELPKGSIKKLIGRELTWDDEPVELKSDISNYRNK